VAAVLLAGFAAAQAVQMTECRGDTSHQDMTPALETYCDEGWIWVAIGWPGALVAAGAIAARVTGRRWPLARAAVLGTAAAMSPIGAAFVMG
jgi:hypothetical protein